MQQLGCEGHVIVQEGDEIYQLTVSCPQCLIEQGWEQAMAQVVEAVEKLHNEVPNWGIRSQVLCRVITVLESLQPDNGESLGSRLDKAHDAALPHAVEQIISALDGGGEFAVGSPLAKLMDKLAQRDDRAEERQRGGKLREALENFINSSNNDVNDTCVFCRRIDETHSEDCPVEIARAAIAEYD